MTTTILEQSPTSLQVGFTNPPSGPVPPRKNPIFKPTLGTPGPGARLALLPSQKSRAHFMGASMAVQVVVLGVILLIPLVFPQKFRPAIAYQVMDIATPRTEVPVPEQPKPAPVQPKPKPVPVAKIQPPPPVEMPKPRIVPHFALPTPPKPKPVEKVETPKIAAPAFEAAKVDIPMAAPRKPVEHTDLNNTGSAAPATLPAKTDPAKVQTGGFGDPNGMPGPSNPNKHANINRAGSFDLPPGPGYGNGTGGANGARGTVASSGFGNGTAIQNGSTGGGGTHGTIQQGGFSTATVDTSKPEAHQQQQVAAVTPVEITDKPRPDYTEEARNLKLEGEVLLSVIFKANGQIQVLGVTKGLGHGLDESAIRAAQRIRFKPALSSGQPVDFPATVHIVFQLAY
jgi:TonB family protein